MSDATSGFIILHGNRLEALGDIVVAWLRQHPLPPWEDDVVLVQSNGIAHWLRSALARPEDRGGLGIAAGVRVDLPARFLWRMYRRVLGETRVRDESPYVKHRLAWRLVRLLPLLADRPEFAPLKRYLDHTAAATESADLRDLAWRRRCALAERVADVFDGYQVYRADWLTDWAAGRDVLRDELRRPGDPQLLGEDQRWQPALWRAILEDLARAGGAEATELHRGAVHAQFLQALQQPPRLPLPRRVVVFGISSLPQQSLEAIAALARQCEVILAVLAPCQHDWSDIIEGRELLRATRRRHGTRPGLPAEIAVEDLHLHANPLLAAWGKQGRDFVRLLDAFDDPGAYTRRFTEAGHRIDHFETPAGPSLLAGLHRAILDLDPLPPPGHRLRVARDDASITFHVCHSAQREIEVLHDALLARFDAASAEGAPLSPRDIIVMVPDIEAYAPVVEAVFGALPRHDRRFIPYSIADRTARRTDPILLVAQFLIGLGESRLPVSEVLDVLDVPAVQARFGLGPGAMPTLRRWIEATGIRWGLNADHRAAQGLGQLGAQNTWQFGLRRMLLGYLAGDCGVIDDTASYADVGGLDAEAVGSLADVLDAIDEARPRLAEEHSPTQWGEILRDVLDRFLEPVGDEEVLSLERLRTAIAQWVEACVEAEAEMPMPASVVGEAVLAGLDEIRVSQRFGAGGVTFATLMPMRAIPFQVVAILGMNDGDYPRRRQDTDFDLMTTPGTQRPGDRSRRDDDRYLLLEALLSARRALHIGWCGRSARNNTARPPSVLVGQLRDYLAAGWCMEGDTDDDQAGVALLQQLTLEHPLQPFSRRYFEAPGAPLPTYMGEWDQRLAAAPAPAPLAFDRPVTIERARLAAFVRNPVKAFFTDRLGVVFDAPADETLDDEPFDLNRLETYGLMQDIVLRALAETTPSNDSVVRIVAELKAAGRLPIAALGELYRKDLLTSATDLVGRFRAVTASAERVALTSVIDVAGTAIPASDLKLWRTTEGIVQLDWSANALVTKKTPKYHRLAAALVNHALANAALGAVTTRLVAPGGEVRLRPFEGAHDWLATLVDAYVAGMQRPLPVAPKTAVAWLDKPDTDKARAAARAQYEGNRFTSGGESDDPYLARVYPTFADLESAGSATQALLYAPLLALIEVVTSADAELDLEVLA